MENGVKFNELFCDICKYVKMQPHDVKLSSDEKRYERRDAVTA